MIHRNAASILVLLVAVICIGYPLTCSAQEFSVSGTTIKAPDGSDFLVKGVNVNGPYWPWGRSTVQDLSLIVDDWKFNTVRVNCFPSLQGTFPNNNADLDAIVNQFTSHSVVTIIENHDFTGRYPAADELTQLTSWWTAKANAYKGNTYVWFNIANEPGSDGVAPDIWKTFHETVIQAIRATGADNIIVLDGHQFGQENGYASADQSAVQTFGEYFVSNYSNIVFSLHMYDRWVYGKERLTSYIQDAAAKNLCVIIGEYGTAMDNSKGVAKDMFEAVLPLNVGRIAWQWDGTDGHRLTVDKGGWNIDVTDGSKPTNLSFVGNLIWEDNHNSLVVGSSAFAVPGPWLVNGDFEDNLNGWINFGGGNLETSPSNVKSGTKALHVLGGGDGGAVQLLYLSPDSTYVFSAYGKNSLASESASIGVQYKVDGVQQQHVLTFTTQSYVQQKVEFTVPHKLSDASVFIYKPSNANTFYADKLSITLKGDQITPVEKDVETGNLFEVFPNPFSETIRIRFKASHPTAMSLLSASGQVVFRSSDIAGEFADVSTRTLAPGLYELVVQFGLRTYAAKLVKK